MAILSASLARLPKRDGPASSSFRDPVRPFVVPPVTEETDLEAWQRRAEAFGHRLEPRGGGRSLPDVSRKPTAPEPSPGAPVTQLMRRFVTGTARAAKREFRGGGGGGGGGGEDWQRRLAALKQMEKARRESSVKIDWEKYNPKIARPPLGRLYRSDDYPFHSTKPTKPGRGTKKASIDLQGVLTPVNPLGKTTPALHVHGKMRDKADSPFISTTPDLEKASSYGKHLLEFDPETLKEQTVGQEAIQEDIRKSTDPRLTETARNVTQPGKPLWKPSESQKTEGRELGIDTLKEEFNYRERAALNSQRDREHLVQGPTSDFQFWRFISARTFGSQFANHNWEEIGRRQGRDPRTLHPEGFRVPLDAYGLEYMARQERYRQQQQEIEREREEDEAYRRSLSTAVTVPTPTGEPPRRVHIPGQTGGPSPGREEQYNQRIKRLRAKLKDKTVGE